MQYKIKAIQNIGIVYRYLIEKDKSIHTAFCGLLIDLGIDKDEVLEQLDIIFDDLNDEFIYLNNNNLDIYLFITKDNINLVIKTKINQKELNKKISKYFILPE